MRGSQRTTLLFHGAALSERSCDLLTGQGEIASVERPVAVGHLQDTVGLGNERRRKQRQTFDLIHFV